MKLLLQNDFGGENRGKMNCSLTSITAVTSHYLGDKHDISEIYSKVESIAYHFFFDPNGRGTLSIMIKPILNRVFKSFGIDRKTHWRVFKGIGFSLKTITRQLDAESPVILSLWDYDNGHYHDHTVTIVRYEGNILYIHDNWNKCEKTIDYNKLGFIASINY